MERVLPNFFVIGAPKAGTTSLWHLLRQHPDVFMPATKEPWFLSHDDRYEDLGWSWYRGLFEGGSSASAVGEASSCYCMTRLYPNAVARLGRYFPDARVIYCVREPYARIESAWKQCLSARHVMPREFAEAVRTYPPIVEGSRYGESLSRYLEIFPRDRIHIVPFGALKTEPALTLRRCFEFLEVDPSFVPDGMHEAKNRSVDKRVDTWAYRAVEGTWLWQQRNWLTPTPIRNRLRWVLRRPIPAPVWPSELKAWVRRILEDDTSAFLELAALADDPWAGETRTLVERRR